MKDSKILLLLLMLMLPAMLKAQDYTVSALGGYLCSLSPNERYIQTETAGLDVAWSQKTDGSRFWHRWWGLPTLGVRANYTHVFDGIAGDFYGAMGFIQSPFGRRPEDWYRKTRFYWEFGAGFSGYTKPFPRTGDEANNFIGSSLNCLLHVGVGCRVQVSPQGDAIQLAAKIVHTSNGQLTPHNRGLNYLQGSVGYSIPSKRQQLAQQQRAPLPQDSVGRCYPTLFVAYAPSFVLTRYGDSPRDYYYAHTAQLGAKIHLHECLAFGLSYDLMYNYSHTDRLLSHGYHYPYQFNLGISGFVEPRWGRVSMRAGCGVYIPAFRNPLIEGPIYERFGIYYYLDKKMRHSVGVAMKLHYARIDYIEWTYAIDLPLGR